MFHVSLLRPFVEGKSVGAIVSLPQEFVAGRSVVCPVRVLESRVALKDGQPVEQVLVRWSDEEDSVATWEPREVMARHFPLLLEVKELLIGEGVDTGTTSRQTRDEPEVSEEHLEDSSDEESITPESPRRTAR